MEINLAGAGPVSGNNSMSRDGSEKVSVLFILSLASYNFLNAAYIIFTISTPIPSLTPH